MTILFLEANGNFAKIASNLEGDRQRIALGGLSPSLDPDAAAYIAAVEAADTQALEAGVIAAINGFVVGCKADGIWSAIKASCILAGARTLNGIFTPLVGPAPTNFNFVSGDYNRKTGLVGNGSSKYLNTNRAGNAEPQNSFHLSAFLTTQPNPTASVNYSYLAGSINATGSNLIGRSGTAATRFTGQSRSNTSAALPGGTAVAGFVGSSRAVSTEFTYRVAGANATASITSQAQNSSNIEAFRWVNAGTPGAYAPNRIAFYSIGEALDLAQLDSRVSALITAIDGAIP
jgi:hypothetical protein